MSEAQLRETICHIGRLMHQFTLVDGTSGNISVRLGEDRVLVTPSGVGKGQMTPDQLIIIDMDGIKVGDGTPDYLKPTSETPMHLEAYKQRSDVNAVIHAHPTYAVALTIAGLDLQTYTIPEAIISLGHVPTTPYSTPASLENRDAICELIRDHDSILLSYHGSLTVGVDLWAAYYRLEMLEHTAKLIHLVHQLGGGQPLPAHQIEKLVKLQGVYNTVQIT